MQAENSEVIALVSKPGIIPRSRIHAVSSHVVRLNRPFIEELEIVSDKLEQQLSSNRKVSLVARMDTGILAVAALMEQPELSKVVTFWSAFKGGVNRFEREGGEWLTEFKGDLKPLLHKVTTVYTKSCSPFYDTLDGAEISIVDCGKQIRKWRDGLDKLWREPIDVYLNK